jgi:hypothetical protein
MFIKKMIESTNPKVSKTVGHISLDFSGQDKDKLTNAKMVQVAKEYMSKMGITNTQYNTICRQLITGLWREKRNICTVK